MTARISLFATAIAAALVSCDTEQNVAPVYQTYFTKYYGEDGDQTAVDLAVNADGTLVFVGTSKLQTNPATHTFIVKTDGQGTVLWEKPIGENEEPVEISFDSRNDIIVLSNLQSRSIRVRRLSQSGALMDSVLIENPAGLTATAVTEIDDDQGSSFLVTGYAGPTLVQDPEMPAPADSEDLLIYKVNSSFDEPPILQAVQGGEHVGKIVKIFQSPLSGPIRYYRFGDSDSPLVDGGVFRQTFQVVAMNDFFIASSKILQSGPEAEIQVSSEAIEMLVAGQPGYLMVGATGPKQSLVKQIFVTQYTDGRPDLGVRFSKVIRTPRSAEGVSVAYGEQESMFVLANELQDNNNSDIYLTKLQSDGEVMGEMRFGSVEGDDQAAAVRVLPDQRVAVFGTIELETQKKMMLTLISPQGTFSD